MTSSGSVVSRSNTCPSQISRTIPVDLDAVTVRIAEVDRLADEVIRETTSGTLSRLACEPTGDLDALGQEQREVVEAGGP